MRTAIVLETILAKTGRLLAWAALLPMIVFAALEPVSRWLGAQALPFDEAATSLFFALTMLSFGYAYAAGAHVRLDFFSRRFAPRTRAAIELCGVVLILLPLCLLVMADSADSAWRSFQQGERWGGTTLPFQWLVRASVAAGFLLLLLAGAAAALRALATLFRR
jgi:TRAP-type mannitol/chloroaromatic compound transport system permease small subunit